MQIAITEDLIRLLHQERVNAGVRSWHVSQALKEAPEERCRMTGAWRLVPLSLRPAACR